MSQTVKIDAAAQDAIAEIVGMPWEKDYFDNTHDKDSAHIATVTREGTSVRIYVCDESLCSADLWSFEAEQIGQAILNAAKDAKTFTKAQTEWSRSQMQRLNCEIDGTQNIWGYEFYVTASVMESTSQRMIASQRIRKFGRASSLTALALLFSKK